MIETIRVIVQVLVALGIFNVWLIRFGKPTKWRSREALDMRSEFEVYGLPGWFMILIGTAKLILAFCLIAGCWFPVITRPAAMGLAALMLGAITMHIKVGDANMKSLPATCMFAGALFVAFG